MVAMRIQSAKNTSASEFDLADVRVSLKSLMGRLVGVQRNAEELREAANSIHSFATYVMAHQFDGVEGWELQNLITTAQCIVGSAMARTESRGVHFRSDHPETDDPNWRRHLTMQVDIDGGHPQLAPLHTFDPAPAVGDAADCCNG